MPTPLEVIPYKPSSDKKVLRYPLADIHEKTDYLQIDVIEYTAIKSTNAAVNVFKVPDSNAIGVFTDDNPAPLVDKSRTSITARAGGIRQNSKKASRATILLPIPSSISDSNTQYRINHQI